MRHPRIAARALFGCFKRAKISPYTQRLEPLRYDHCAADDGRLHIPNIKKTMNTDEAADSLKDAANDVKRGVSGVLEDAREKAEHLYERARGRVRTLGEDGVEYVRDNPVKTLLTAAAIGFAIGFAARR